MRLIFHSRDRTPPYCFSGQIKLNLHTPGIMLSQVHTLHELF
jgi:hypothetical protein